MNAIGSGIQNRIGEKDEVSSLVGLPSCDYRAMIGERDTFFCRHRRVHTDRYLVDAAICRGCLQRVTSCDPRPVPDTPLTERRHVEPSRLEYISLERLVRDIRDFASRLPADVVAVAGIPRSGMIPASMLASLLHRPLYELHSEGLRAVEHGERIRPERHAQGTVVIIDDSVHGGAAMRRARGLLHQFPSRWEPLFAAVYPRPEKAHLVDLFGRLCPSPHLFEWNLFNCFDTQKFAFDMDGILCEDWPGGNEEGSEYLQFLAEARPKWLPRRMAIPLIVTARLQRHRQATIDWLKRHGVRAKKLVMGPWADTSERRRQYDAARFKGQAYEDSNCTLFIESNVSQALAIFEATGKPVLHPSTERIFQ